MFSGSFATTGSWERPKLRSPPSRRQPPKRVRGQEKTCPVLHPLQKMVISQNLLRKTPRRSLLRRRHIQHALVQLGERMGRHDSGVTRRYPELIRLASHPVEEVRNTDAWVMGQDTSGPGFHETLLKMLQDPSPMVRGNAALSLVRFGDASGRPQIVGLVQPARIVAPSAGRVIDTDKVGTAIHQGGLIAKLQVDHSAVASQNGQQTIEVRSPISGRIRTLSAATGANVTAGTEVATVDPGDEQVWEALRALYLIGQPDDLPAIRPYQRNLPEISGRIRQQALLTDKAIRDRAAH